MRGFAAAVLSVILSCQALVAGAALAAEPVFPAASRIGLVPPDAMILSKRFTGFENEEKAAVITLAEMPPEAYGQLLTGLTKDVLKRQGLSVTSREEVKLGARSGLLIAGTLAGPVSGRKWIMAVKDAGLTALIVAQVPGGQDGYSEAQMRDALKSVALREAVSLDEQVAALPFRIGDRAGFRPVKVLSGNSVLLTDGPKDAIAGVEQPMAILAASLAVPPPVGEQRNRFAQLALNSNRTLKDIRIERSEGFRLRGQDWHEIVARATDTESGQPVVVMQTIRFEPDHYVRMVGLARAESRDQTLPRFRTMIDSVEMEP
jgi:hypothetical protein